MRSPRFVSALLALCLLSPVAASAANAPGESPLPPIKSETKPWTRWWWLGSAVDKENLTREMESIAAAGFGGVEITPIYGAKGYESRFLPFLSDPYMAMLAHVTSEAKRLGLGVDMATGTGWPFGGPWVGPEDVELKLDLKDGKLGSKPSGFKVKRSAPGGEGFVLNPYSSTAMAHYLVPFTKALASLPPGAMRSQFHDSFEYTANWAKEVPEKFRALHGYDLADHVAELSGQGDPDTVARVKADYRTTLGALHLEYVNTWVAWAHSRHELARNQAHGSPGNLLDLYAAADIPETEIFGSNDFPIPYFRRDKEDYDRPAHPPIIHRFASSAAHLTGKPFASSETFTGLREHFREAPSQMKPEVDRLFLTGINHIFYHGNAYSPADAPWPGWLFYASTQFNTRNPLWRDFAGINGYIARCQALLQSGQPDNDLLVYWPADDIWHNPQGLQIQLTVHASWLENTPCGQLMTELTKKGYAYDLVSDTQLASLKVQGGQIRSPTLAYRTIVVPQTEHMEPTTFTRLLDLADEGATVVFLGKLPADVPGLGQLAERREKLRQASSGLKFADNSTPVREAKLGRGRILLATGVTVPLEQQNIPRETSTDRGIEIIRRRLPQGVAYFMVNNGDHAYADWLDLAYRGLTLEPNAVVDPLTGRVSTPYVRAGKDQSFSVYVQLEPGQSLLLWSGLPAASPASPSEIFATGKPMTLEGPWQVSFISGGPALPPGFIAKELKSWTSQGGEAERFGGTARYETTFTVPADAKATDWTLDLGDVRETARVIVNGKPVDLLWSLPFRTNIGAYVKPGENTLTLEVTNTAANRIRDLDQRKVTWKAFHEINFVDIRYKPFDASGWKLQPSGLLGPVRLTPLTPTKPEAR
jgi:hypothetical protein